MLLPSRKIFELFKQQEGLTDIQRAARFFFVLQNSFGSRLAGVPSFGYARTRPSRFSAQKAEELIRAVHARLAKVFIENRDFVDIFARYDSEASFFYCDPPYVEVAGYRRSFNRIDHVRLLGALKGAKGNWLLSYNDHPWVRELYEEFPHYLVEVYYSINPGGKRTRELLISKTPLDEKLMSTAPKRIRRLKGA